MKALSLLVFLFISLGASACSKDRVATFTDTCMTDAKLDQTTCTCMAQKANQELSPAGMDFVIASMRNDKAATARLRSQIASTEAAAVAMFLPRTSVACAPERKVN